MITKPSYNDWKRNTLKEWLASSTVKDLVRTQADDDWVDSLNGGELAAIQTPGDCYLWRGQQMWRDRMQRRAEREAAEHIVCMQCGNNEWIHQDQSWVCTGCLSIGTFQ